MFVYTYTPTQPPLQCSSVLGYVLLRLYTLPSSALYGSQKDLITEEALMQSPSQERADVRLTMVSMLILECSEDISGTLLSSWQSMRDGLALRHKGSLLHCMPVDYCSLACLYPVMPPPVAAHDVSANKAIENAGSR